MFRVSCIQMCSSEDVNHNLKITKRLIIKAVKQKSDFILTPENSSLFSLKKENLLKMTTTMKNDFYLQEIKKLAKKYRKWILLGSIIVKEKNKLKNRSVLISPKAKVVAYYDKINMYDAVLSTKL
jgi:predicted amidohydrolase